MSAEGTSAQQGQSRDKPQSQTDQTQSGRDELYTDQVLTQLRNKDIPKKFSKTPPTWSKKDPEDLIDWLEDVEDTLSQHGVTKGRAKIDYALRWMDQKTKREMEELPAAKGSDWDEFKTALHDCFPEAVATNQGSKIRLEKIVNEHRLVPLGSLDKALQYNRAFGTEARKLMGPENPVISNSDAVTLYRRGLEDKLIDEV
ncbi:hypothetical protein K435DRAFT_681311, partial [Dendrothele bispora CBS 962.96]